MEAEGVELPSAILAARLLILTGCRLNEIMTLKWNHIDLGDRVLRLPDSKPAPRPFISDSPPSNCWATPSASTAIRGSYRHPAGQAAERPSALLAACPRPRRGEGRPHPRPAPHLRVTAVASGQGLPMIGKLLGHTQVQTTARYAHLAAEPVRMAADAVSQNLRQSLG